MFARKFEEQDKQMFLAGDFNIDSLNYSQNSINFDFLNFDFQNSILAAIKRPTRVTKAHATIIDYILTILSNQT